MKKSIALVGAALSLACVAGHATTVLKFDDIALNHNANFGPNFGVVQDGYGGLNWLNTIVEPEDPFIPGSLNMNVSLPNVATDANYLGYSLNAAPIQFSAATAFDFKSAYFIANQVEGLKVRVQGLRDGIIVDSTTLTVGTQAPVLGVFNWDVDTVIMTTSGSNDMTRHQSFSFDNLAVSAVPEPGIPAMGLAGAALLAVLRKRRLR